jgi:diphthine synthase
MLYLIGLGLSKEGISYFGLETVKRCKKIYIENYTVYFPYDLKEIEELIGKKVQLADREFVESLKIVDEAKKQDVALLIYGSPLTATTHITLVNEAKQMGIKCRVLYNASIIDAIAETGLQLYKFGKIASMPKWDEKKHFTPDSFLDVVKENQSINAHTLLLIDIGLNFDDAMEQLKAAIKKQNVKVEKIVVCQSLGSGSARIFYTHIDQSKSIPRILKPYCIIIPSKLHFVEKQSLEMYA